MTIEELDMNYSLNVFINKVNIIIKIRRLNLDNIMIMEATLFSLSLCH